MMWPNRQVRFISKTILNCRDQSDRVSFVMKTRQDNNMIDRIGLVYAETETQMSGTI